jgi:hypothetical protein
MSWVLCRFGTSAPYVMLCRKKSAIKSSLRRSWYSVTQVICAGYREYTCVTRYQFLRTKILVLEDGNTSADARCPRVPSFRTSIFVKPDKFSRVTHGTISSFKPLKNRNGIVVMVGKVSSLGQIW